jgi:DUF438 domain-containing protein
MSGIGLEARLRRSVLEELAVILTRGAASRSDLEKAKPAIDEADPEDVAVTIDALIGRGIGGDALKTGVSRLLNVLARRLNARVFSPSDPFFRLLLAENRGIQKSLDACRGPLGGLNRPEVSKGSSESIVQELAEAVAALAPLESHYRKKENVLFPYFEARFPRYRCLSLMWAIHDDARSALRSIGSLLSCPDRSPSFLKALNELSGRLFFAVNSLVFREERILFPVASGLLSEREKAGLDREAKGLGVCFIDETQVADLDASASAIEGYLAFDEKATSRPDLASAEAIGLDSGSLERSILDSILKSLPVDITFVDSDNRVRYFSNGGARVFPRSPAIIGRDVRNCHPSASVDRVMAIIDAFRSGSLDREAFWLVVGGRFVHIEYRAIRGADKRYLGTLEISQDLTEARSLTGEKRLSSFS